jgi:hypothetical protein
MRTVASQVDEPLRRVALQFVELVARHFTVLKGLRRGGR